MKKLKSEIIRNFVENRGGILFPNFKYKNSRNKFNVKDCGFGHTFKTSWDILRLGSWCPTCGHSHRIKNIKKEVKKEIINFVELKKGKVNNIEEYKNNKTKLELVCNKGHSWKVCWSSLQQGTWCPICSRIKAKNKCKQEKNYILDFIKDKKGKVEKDWTYVNNSSKFLIVNCGRGHSFETTWNHIQSGHWCPHCHFKTEQDFRNLIENYFKQSFPKKRPKWLYYSETKRRLELDGYCKELKIAFEYQGYQHRQKGWHDNEDSYRERLKRDDFKRRRCKERGILLIEVPDYIPKEKWINGIKNKFNRGNNAQD